MIPLVAAALSVGARVAAPAAMRLVGTAATRVGAKTATSLAARGLGERSAALAGRGIESGTRFAGQTAINYMQNRLNSSSSTPTSSTPTYEPRLQNFNHGYDSSASTGAYSPGNPLN